MISSNALKLITDSEGCDLSASWAGGGSGISYGFGYDLGYNSKEQIKKDWGSLVNGNLLAFMLTCSGVKGEAAKKLITPEVRTLKITIEIARKVLNESTLPRFKKLALDTYEGLDKLPEDTIGAIVSLVYNRGTSFGTIGKPSWDSRKEMRELEPLIASGDLEGIAATIKEMSRLWVGKGLDGLITRRNNEAELVLSSAQS